MPHLEPTYLRYIYDGLIKGSIHPENAAELPEGLIGLYEEAFDERTSVIDRQKLIQRFALWALLKKEVSAAFVAEILGETEDDIQEFISTYSAWFNSPESGKYQIYHERLKVYLLQKLSEGEIHTLHEKLIGRLEQAIAAQKADDFEWYGLEFLGLHIYISDAEESCLFRLTSLCENQNFIGRQIDLSGHYEWPKINLKYLAISGSKKNDDYIVKSALGLVKIHLKEISDVDTIFKLLEEKRFELALFRIDSQLKNESKEDKFVYYFQLLEELLNKPWAGIQHLSEVIEHFTKSIDKIFYHNIDSLIVKHLKTLEELWKREINILFLLNFFHFYKAEKIDFDENNTTSILKTSIYNVIGVDFAISFLSDNSKVQYIAANSKNFEEFETNINVYGYSFNNFDSIKNYWDDIKRLQFIDDKRLIDFEAFGTSILLYSFLIEQNKIDVFIDFLDYANEIKFSKKKKSGIRRSIYSVEAYLFFIDWFLKKDDKAKAEHYLKKCYYFLDYYINKLENGDYFLLEEIVKVLNFAEELKRQDIILHISEKTLKGFEIWKSWNDEFIIKDISCILMHELIFNSNIENWLNSFDFKEQNKFLINAIVPYWPNEYLKTKQFEFTSVSSKLICIETVSKNEKEKLKNLLLRDISSHNKFKFFPFILFATENNDSNLILEMISRLEMVNKFSLSYYLTFFEIKNRSKISASNSELICESSEKFKSQILNENGSIEKLLYLLRILELQLSLLDNNNAEETIKEINMLDRIAFDKNDMDFFLNLIKELIFQYVANDRLKWQLIGLYNIVRKTKFGFWGPQFYKYLKQIRWYFNYLAIVFNALTNYIPKHDKKKSYLSNWDKIYEFENKEKHKLSYWLESYLSSLKKHLAKSMNSIDDETIILLRTYYGLNAMKKDNVLKKDDYEFLELEWTFQLKGIQTN